MKLKVLIAEPSQVVTEGLQSMLNDCAKLEVVCTIDDIGMMEERIMVKHPDIVVINPCILPYTRQIPANLDLPEGCFAVGLVYQYFEPSFLRNFDAIIDIRDSKPDIISTLLNLEQIGEHKKGASDGASELTKRERDILVLVAKGLMSKEIAEQLNISIHTVISHRKNITKKTGIKSVAGLAVYAMLNNLMSEPKSDELQE